MKGWARDAWYMKRRKAWETMALGIPEDAPASDRPIYALVGTPGKTIHGLDQLYGSVKIILNRDRLKKRSTYTTNDSLNDFQLPFRYGQAELTTSDLHNIAENKKKYPDRPPFDSNMWSLTGGDDPKFIEAQIFGGLTREDMSGTLVVTAGMVSQKTIEGWVDSGFEVLIKKNDGSLVPQAEYHGEEARITRDFQKNLREKREKQID
jgi:hypothetical protein